MKMRVKRLVLMSLLAVSVLMISGGEAFADKGLDTLRQTSRAFSDVAKKVTPAVVSVKVEKTISGQVNPHSYGLPYGDEFFDKFFGPRGDGRSRVRPNTPGPDRRQVGQGSGFIISEDGYILSNTHVVGNADKITVTLNDGREFKAKLIGADRSSDVAVIKIEAENLPLVILGDSDELEVGSWAIAVGNPFGLNASLTVGVVSAKGRSDLQIVDGGAGFEDFIQTDAAINPGNSGGPLLNIDGEAIGLNTAIFSQSGGYQGIGFAIPINMAKSIKDQLVATGKVVRGFVGIFGSDIEPNLAKEMKIENTRSIQILQVAEDTPAEKAGLEAGDIIMKLDGKDIEGWGAFRAKIAMKSPGTKVELTVLRDSKKKKIKVIIGSRDEGLAVAEVEQNQPGKELGLQVQVLTEELAAAFGYEGLNGVLISSIEAGSQAERAGLKEGILILKVDDTRVGSVEDFNEVCEKSMKDGLVRLLVTDGGNIVWVVLSKE